MNFEELTELLFFNLKKKIKNQKSIDVFVSNRSKFEGWLKVEIIEIMINNGCKNVLPEKDRIDVTFDSWAMELKTCNTSYRYKELEPKTRPITLNITQILEDVEKLQKTTGYENKAVFFVAFPLKHEKKEWQNIHLSKISNKINQMRHVQLHTSNGIPLVLYISQI